jgi:hypothetical protein
VSLHHFTSMRAAAAVRGGEPSVYLTSGRKTYPVDVGWTTHTTPSHVRTMKSTITVNDTKHSSTIDKRLEDDRFFLGDGLVQGTDENVSGAKPFVLFEVRVAAATKN